MNTREIKFRVWDSNFKKMLPLHEAKFVNGTLVGAKGINWDSQVIVMQFTGLKDKNGKEIYEGDFFAKNGGVVVWNKHDCGFVVEGKNWKNPVILYQDHAILGNIYENPELLSQ